MQTAAAARTTGSLSSERAVPESPQAREAGEAPAVHHQAARRGSRGLWRSLRLLRRDGAPLPNARSRGGRRLCGAQAPRHVADLRGSASARLPAALPTALLELQSRPRAKRWRVSAQVAAEGGRLMAGLTRTTQQQFGGGTYRNGALELIPPNGCFDISNGLLNLAGDVFRRGGSTYRSNAPFGSGLRWIWDGWLATSGHTTLIASTTEYGKLEGSGAVTALGHGGQSSPGKAVAYKGVLYLPGGQTYDGTTWGTAAKVAPYYAVVANRLLAASNDTVWFSHISTAGVPEPAKYEPNDFHTIPGGVQILGIEGGRDSCIVFTTGGVWVISNMAMNLVDATGNVQQRLDRFSGDLVLWGAQGIAAWQGNLIVPGTDAVWLINRGVSSEVPKSFSRIGDPIHSLYEEYVRSSYVPGGACVHESNYLLPVLGYGTVVDLLACRLDIPHPAGQGQGAWSRLAGSGAKVPALVSRVSDQTAREPELLGVEHEGNRRVLTLNYYLPTAVNHRDADGTVPPFSLETRGYATGQLDVNLVARLRIGYRCSDNEG